MNCWLSFHSFSLCMNYNYVYMQVKRLIRKKQQICLSQTAVGQPKKINVFFSCIGVLGLTGLRHSYYT